MSEKILRDFIKLLVDNEVQFTVPGCYELPVGIVEQAAKELATFGKSHIIKRHRDWSYALWDLDYLKKYGHRQSVNSDEFSSDELRNILELKAYWNDPNDVEAVEEMLAQVLINDDRKSTYAFRRKIGFTPALKRACLARDGYACVWCATKKELQVDHIVEVIDGGTNELENLQTLCRPCHVQKTAHAREQRKNTKLL